MGSTHPQPGRLGNPDETLASDPRSDPRLVAALEPFGLGGRGDPLPLEGALHDVYRASLNDVVGFAEAV